MCWGHLKIIFSKFTGLTSKHPWMNEIQDFFQIEEQRIFLRGNNSDIVKIHYRPKTSSLELSGQI